MSKPLGLHASSDHVVQKWSLHRLHLRIFLGSLSSYGASARSFLGSFLPIPKNESDVLPLARRVGSLALGPCRPVRQAIVRVWFCVKLMSPESHRVSAKPKPKLPHGPILTRGVSVSLFLSLFLFVPQKILATVALLTCVRSAFFISQLSGACFGRLPERHTQLEHIAMHDQHHAPDRDALGPAYGSAPVPALRGRDWLCQHLAAHLPGFVQ